MTLEQTKVPYRKGGKMNQEEKKTETVVFMLNSLNEDNRNICLQNGMSTEDIDRNIEQSQQSLAYMLSNMYDKMKEANLLA
jgi:hypothetical protein